MKHVTNKEFMKYVTEKSLTKVSKCLQCLKCTAGCPLSSWMDYKPNQINRMIQMGDRDKVLGSSVIWLCVGCQTCVTRCPMKINIPDLMDTLREVAVKERVSKEPNITMFHQLFLNSVKRWGRVHELELIGLYKLKSGQLFSDMQLGQQMFMKGKLALLPDGVRNKKGIREIFEKVK
ncbi:4Fe-4S dicluster domain-containing protein [bacterium]|nr:4Fe-4S dicluster domain-containing protein [bacterium]MBU1152414.1 4Fe-4S dicluster domain-containing protein [bacterium]